jgi:hypothetical protein
VASALAGFTLEDRKNFLRELAHFIEESLLQLAGSDLQVSRMFDRCAAHALASCTFQKGDLPCVEGLWPLAAGLLRRSTDPGSSVTQFAALWSLRCLDSLLVDAVESKRYPSVGSVEGLYHQLATVVLPSGSQSNKVARVCSGLVLKVLRSASEGRKDIAELLFKLGWSVVMAAVMWLDHRGSWRLSRLARAHLRVLEKRMYAVVPDPGASGSHLSVMLGMQPEISYSSSVVGINKVMKALFKKEFSSVDSDLCAAQLRDIGFTPFVAACLARMTVFSSREDRFRAPWDVLQEFVARCYAGCYNQGSVILSSLSFYFLCLFL